MKTRKLYLSPVQAIDFVAQGRDVFVTLLGKQVKCNEDTLFQISDGGKKYYTLEPVDNYE